MLHPPPVCGTAGRTLNWHALPSSSRRIRGCPAHPQMRRQLTSGLRQGQVWIWSAALADRYRAEFALGLRGVFSAGRDPRCGGNISLGYPEDQHRQVQMLAGGPYPFIDLALARGVQGKLGLVQILGRSVPAADRLLAADEIHRYSGAHEVTPSEGDR
jgi:hypothetical protein